MGLPAAFPQRYASVQCWAGTRDGSDHMALLAVTTAAAEGGAARTRLFSCAAPARSREQARASAALQAALALGLAAGDA
jgi:hypothetical protein